MPIDDQVKAAMARWPNVPAVFGWLRLDRRGRWMLIDRGQPGFDEALHGAGSEITSPPIIDFIGRNYLCDDQGRWYWQNGPQRAFVDLDLAPLVLRVLGDAPTQSLVTHTGYPVHEVRQVQCDTDGTLWLLTEHGPGCVDDRDLGALDLELDPDWDAPHAPADTAASTAPVGRLHLQGSHPVHRLGECAARHFGFVTRPR